MKQFRNLLILIALVIIIVKNNFNIKNNNFNNNNNNNNNRITNLQKENTKFKYEINKKIKESDINAEKKIISILEKKGLNNNVQ